MSMYFYHLHHPYQLHPTPEADNFALGKPSPDKGYRRIRDELERYHGMIVSHIIGDHNNNAFVFDTFDAALEASPKAHPIFHSDRGFQYTNRVFHGKLEAARMIQRMSRVAKCIDNGTMVGFRGIIKSERYYGKTRTIFTSSIKTASGIIRWQEKLYIFLIVYLTGSGSICTAAPCDSFFINLSYL